MLADEGPPDAATKQARTPGLLESIRIARACTADRDGFYIPSVSGEICKSEHVFGVSHEDVTPRTVRAMSDLLRLFRALAESLQSDGRRELLPLRSMQRCVDGSEDRGRGPQLRHAGSQDARTTNGEVNGRPAASARRTDLLSLVGGKRKAAEVSEGTATQPRHRPIQ